MRNPIASSGPDTLDDVLDLAAEIIREYGGDPQGTRIERLAHWVATNLGGPPYTLKQATQEFDDSGPLNREHAVAILRILENQ